VCSHSYFSKAYTSLSDWPELVKNYCNLSKKYQVARATDDDMLGASSKNHLRFIAGIRCLTAACEYGETVKYYKILRNVMALASCLWWLAMVCLLGVRLYSASKVTILRVSMIYHQINICWWIVLRSRLPCHVCGFADSPV
jgi:hypothetical protein